MITANNGNILDTEKKKIEYKDNKKESIENENNFQNYAIKNSQNENGNTKSCKPFIIILIVVGIIIVLILAIALPIALTKKKETRKKKKNEETIIIDGDNYIKTTMKEDFEIPSDGNIQMVGADFQYKKSIMIVGKNKTFFIDDNGKIEDVTKDDFPLYYVFNETITNGSYLFKDVKCFKTMDLSKMDSSKMIDISNMFENSEIEEIYFGTESRERSIRYLDESSESQETREYLIEEEEEEEEASEQEERKEYFDTLNIEKASQLFMNCKKLKKIQFPPSFNVGKKATGLFKGCSKLEEVNTALISSNEIIEMESMFEDCQSLREISFSNNFLTGEIKSLNNVFKNTNLTTLDMIYLRLYNLETCSNIFDGASIKGILKIGKYYSDDNTRDNLFKEIAKVTDSNTDVFVPNGTSINQIFEDIYYSEKNVRISVKVIQIDYNIQYNENGNYKLYSDFLHIGLGWDYNLNNTYDLDSSVLTFDYRINYLDKVNFQQMEAYNGTINLNGDDLTGEGEGDDEEIKVLLNSLPSEVEIFTVQINSYRRNSLKNVKSAYIRLSSDTEVIGTFSINKAGNNIGLLIGCFSKIVSNTSNGWYFRPLNRVIPGNVVTESVNSVQEILHLIFDNNRLISAEELVNRLIIVANNKSVYSQEYKFNSLYWNGTHWSADCSNLIKSIINGRDVYNPKIGSFQKTFPVVEDVNANNLILKCNNISNNFNNLLDVPRLLHLKDNQGNGHVGVYLGKTLISSNGNVNVIESTVSWQANGIIYSWVDHDGTRRLYEGGPLSEMKYNWTSHGSLDQWVW